MFGGSTVNKSMVSAVALVAVAGGAYAATKKVSVLKQIKIIIVKGIDVPAILPVLPPLVTPAPAPTPTPAPMPGMGAPVGTGVPSPTLAGLSAIASGVNFADYIVKSWGTGSIAGPESGQVEGAFRFLCAPSHVAYDDPIVFPGQPGKSHLHTFFGNSKADGNSTYASLRTTGDSSCNTLLNRSAYWIPSLMNGRGKVVLPDYVSIYYKQMPSTDPRCKTVGKACVRIPRGLRYVFGYNMGDPAKGSPAGSFYWNCDGAGAVNGWFPNIAQAAKGCPVGARLGAVLTGPDCWNGTDLDSPDHRSHMAYQQQDGYGHLRCPATHPYIIPHFTIGAWFTTDATLDRSGDESVNANTWYLASDRMTGMAPAVPGTTLHSDWFGAWDDATQELWQANCIDKMLSCSGGDLGNGQQMRTDAGYAFGNKTVLVDIPARG